MIRIRRGHSRNKGRSVWRHGSTIPAYGQPSASRCRIRIDSPLWGGKDELDVLRRRVWVLRQRVERVKQRIGEQKPIKSQKAFAIVDEEECTGCGLCYEVCPTGAVSVNRIAQIDSSKCIACLACVNQCPQGAIAVKYSDRWGDFLS